MARSMLYPYLCLVLAVCPFVLGNPEDADRTACACPPEWTDGVPEIPDVSDETGNAVCDYIEDNNLMTECAKTRTACGSQEGVKFCCCDHASSFPGMQVCFGESKPEYVCVPQDITPWEDGLHAAIQESHTPTNKQFRPQIGGLIPSTMEASEEKHKSRNKEYIHNLGKLKKMRNVGMLKSAMKGRL